MRLHKRWRRLNEPERETMAKVIEKPTVTVLATMEFNEAELRALQALVCYGSNAFLEVFYRYMGRAYLEPHEEGLVELFKSIREQVPPILSRADSARATFAGKYLVLTRVAVTAC